MFKLNILYAYKMDNKEMEQKINRYEATRQATFGK